MCLILGQLSFGPKRVIVEELDAYAIFEDGIAQKFQSLVVSRPLDWRRSDGLSNGWKTKRGNFT